MCTGIHTDSKTRTVSSGCCNIQRCWEIAVICSKVAARPCRVRGQSCQNVLISEQDIARSGAGAGEGPAARNKSTATRIGYAVLSERRNVVEVTAGQRREI